MSDLGMASGMLHAAKRYKECGYLGRIRMGYLSPEDFRAYQDELKKNRELREIVNGWYCTKKGL